MAKPEWTVRPKMYSTMFYYWQRPTIQGLSGTAALQQTLWFGTISAPLTGNFRQRVRSPPVVTFSGAGTTTTVMIRVMMLRMSNHMQLANICSCNNFWSRNNNCSPVAFESQTGTLMSTPLSRQLPPAPTFDVFLHLRSEQRWRSKHVLALASEPGVVQDYKQRVIYIIQDYKQSLVIYIIQGAIVGTGCAV